MAKNTLRLITTRAKAIRRANKGMTWKAAVKKAGAEYRGKKSSGKKRSGKRVSGAEKYIVNANPGQNLPGQRSPGIRVGSLSTTWAGEAQNAASEVNRMTAEINRLLVFQATQSKQGKVLINRQIAQLKQSIRKQQQFLKTASAMNNRKK